MLQLPTASHPRAPGDAGPALVHRRIRRASATIQLMGAPQGRHPPSAAAVWPRGRGPLLRLGPAAGEAQPQAQHRCHEDDPEQQDGYDKDANDPLAEEAVAPARLT